MLIHPWDAALDTAEWQTWLASTDRFGVLAVNNIDSAQAPVLVPTHFTVAADELFIHLARPNPVWQHLEAATEVRVAVIGDYATSRRIGAPRPVAPPMRTGCPRATTPRCNSSAAQRLSTIRRARPTSCRRSSMTSSPRGRHAEVAVGEDPYGRMLPGIRGVRLAVQRVEAKFKYDDANPVEHRERVIGSSRGARPRSRRRGWRSSSGDACPRSATGGLAGGANPDHCVGRRGLLNLDRCPDSGRIRQTVSRPG